MRLPIAPELLRNSSISSIERHIMTFKPSLWRGTIFTRSPLVHTVSSLRLQFIGASLCRGDKLSSKPLPPTSSLVTSGLLSLAHALCVEFDDGFSVFEVVMTLLGRLFVLLEVLAPQLTKLAFDLALLVGRQTSHELVHVVSIVLPRQDAGTNHLIKRQDLDLGVVHSVSVCVVLIEDAS